MTQSVYPPAIGTPEHAAAITQGRHPGVVTAMAWLTFSHLPARFQPFSRPFYMTAMDLIHEIKDSAELTTALNTMVEAKDWAVRAGIRSDQGRPGPVPRPAEVVDPPLIDNRIGPNFGLPVGPPIQLQDNPPVYRKVRDNPQA
jgi:hypothetical protein